STYRYAAGVLPGRRPPVGWAEGGDEGRGKDAADDGGVDADPERECGGENPHVSRGDPRQGDEGQEQDEGRGGDEPASAGDAVAGGVISVVAVVVFFTDAGQQEHFVVHRQAEQEREHRDRYPHSDRPGRGLAEQQLSPDAVLPDQHGDAVGRADRQHVEHQGFGRQHDRAQGPGQPPKRPDDDEGDDPPGVAVDGVDEIGILRRYPADPSAGTFRGKPDTGGGGAAGAAGRGGGRPGLDERRAATAPGRRADHRGDPVDARDGAAYLGGVTGKDFHRLG